MKQQTNKSNNGNWNYPLFSVVSSSRQAIILQQLQQSNARPRIESRGIVSSSARCLLSYITLFRYNSLDWYELVKISFLSCNSELIRLPKNQAIYSVTFLQFNFEVSGFSANTLCTNIPCHSTIYWIIHLTISVIMQYYILEQSVCYITIILY